MKFTFKLNQELKRFWYLWSCSRDQSNNNSNLQLLKYHFLQDQGYTNTSLNSTFSFKLKWKLLHFLVLRELNSVYKARHCLRLVFLVSGYCENDTEYFYIKTQGIPDILMKFTEQMTCKVLERDKQWVIKWNRHWALLKYNLLLKFLKIKGFQTILESWNTAKNESINTMFQRHELQKACWGTD